MSSVPITSKRQLIEYFESGCKPPEKWRIGTEHEKFAYRLDDLRPLEYEGPNGVRAVLEGLEKFGWEPVLENGLPIALKKNDMSSITLEPGGQIELSGAPLETIHQTCKEVGTHLDQVKDVARHLGIGFMGLGYRPKWPLEEIPWMPKGRYKIMGNYMPKKGSMGLDMMLSTCTVQVNLDFESEADMVRKFRVALALQPITTALFANSPFKEGKPNGFLSYRSHIWTDTDPDRCGVLPFVFEEGFGFEQYVDYLLDVPMYFVYRDGQYIDVAGQSFRDFMAGKLPGLPGEIPTMKDFEDHMTTAFPEARLKKYLEMRGADGGPWARLCAMSALWVGLLYDDECVDAAWDLAKNWTIEDHTYLRQEVPRLALKTPFREGIIGDLTLDVLDIAHEGLRRRGRLNEFGQDETMFLNPLFGIADSGQTAAELLLSAYKRRWHENVDPIFKEHAY
ncbi:MAG: glutamate--cysteine ligase [Rhodospirillales bacterium]|nr:glutamate--cysteine ligase [Rhodospirillales bacterium]